MKANTKKLIEFFIKKQLQKQSLSNNEKKEYKSIYNICKSFVTYIKKDCNLLYDFELLIILSFFPMRKKTKTIKIQLKRKSYYSISL